MTREGQTWRIILTILAVAIGFFIYFEHEKPVHGPDDCWTEECREDEMRKITDRALRGY